MSTKKKTNFDKKDTPVVILCGGKGTRLREETELIPKPLVRIGDKPILWHIMKIYYAQGFRRFILLLGYKGEKIKEYFVNYHLYANSFTLKQSGKNTKINFLSTPKENWEITFLDTGLETQTGGRIKQLEKVLKKDKKFLLTYGDGVADVNLINTIKEHEKSRRYVTMTGVPPIARFGEIRLGNKGSYLFYEKPTVTDKLINGGFFVVNTKILPMLSNDPLLNFEVSFLPTLAQSNQLHIVPHNGYWQCMDNIRDMETLNAAWASGNAPWKIWD